MKKSKLPFFVYWNIEKSSVMWFNKIHELACQGSNVTPSGVARILTRGVLEVNYGRKAPEKFRPEATPTNYDVIIAVSGGRNYIEREASCPAT